jgi:hypothetical protein
MIKKEKSMLSRTNKRSRGAGLILLFAMSSACFAQKDAGVRPSPADAGMKNAAVANGPAPSGKSENEKKKENKQKKKNTQEAEPTRSNQEKEFEKVLMGIYG